MPRRVKRLKRRYPPSYKESPTGPTVGGANEQQTPPACGRLSLLHLQEQATRYMGDCGFKSADYYST